MNRGEFIKLPCALYGIYRDSYIDNISIKGRSIIFKNGEGNDFLSCPLSDSVKCQNEGDLSDKYKDAKEKDISLEINWELFSRDGLFEYNDLYAVFEKGDIEKLIKTLKEVVENNGK
jgi:hypothetical protein